MAGKIKSENAVKTDFMYNEENDEWIEAKSYTISYNEFDENGNLTKERSYNSSGEFHEFNDYVYDEKGILIEKVIYLDEDEIAERSIYTNDESGKPVKKTTIYQESSEDYTDFIYNDAGKLIVKARKDEDGYVEEKETAEYNGELLISELSYGLDNELIQKTVYTYDEKGNNISTNYDDYLDGEKSRVEYVINEAGQREKILTYNSENLLIAKSLFEFDEKNRISEIIEEDRKSFKKTRMTYNDAGNVILQEELDNEDNMILSIDRSYDDNGNIVKSAVFIEAAGQNVAQYYEVDYRYEYF
jgi:hypothetical protein